LLSLLTSINSTKRQHVFYGYRLNERIHSEHSIHRFHSYTSR